MKRLAAYQATLDERMSHGAQTAALIQVKTRTTNTPNMPYASSRARLVSARGWRHFAHGADIGVCGYGPTLEAAFEETARALVAVITTEPVAAHERVPIACEAPDLELLLVEWLNALVFEIATRRMLFGRFAVQLNGTRLVGEAWGEAIEIVRHRPAVEVKGATYTALKVTREANGQWIAQCVVDV